MKLWAVRLEVEVFVLAGSEKQACEIAAGFDVRDEVNEQAMDARNWDATESDGRFADADVLPYVPPDYDGPEQTIGEWREAREVERAAEAERRMQLDMFTEEGK